MFLCSVRLAVYFIGFPVDVNAYVLLMLLLSCHFGILRKISEVGKGSSMDLLTRLCIGLSDYQPTRRPSDTDQVHKACKE